MIIGYWNGDISEKVAEKIRKKAYLKLNRDYKYELKRFERNVQKYRYANSPSEKTRYYDKLDMIKSTLSTYLDKGANPNIEIKSGLTGLHYFASLGNFEMVEKLLVKGADPNLKDRGNYDETPIHCACGLEYMFLRKQDELCPQKYVENKNAYLKTIRTLIKFGANPNALDKSKFTPLHIASFSGNVEVVKELLKVNPNMEIVDKKGNTPLIISYLKSNEQVLRHLLKNGANPDNPGSHALSPAKSAVLRRRFADLEHMLVAGAQGAWQDLQEFCDDADDVDKIKEFFEEQRGKIKTVSKRINAVEADDEKSIEPLEERFDECEYPAYYAISLEEYELFDKIIDKYCINDIEKKILMAKILEYDREKAEPMITYGGHHHILGIFPEIRKVLKPFGHSMEVGRRMRPLTDEEKALINKESEPVVKRDSEKDLERVSKKMHIDMML